jgi:hypothetical protein
MQVHGMNGGVLGGIPGLVLLYSVGWMLSIKDPWPYVQSETEMEMQHFSCEPR